MGSTTSAPARDDAAGVDPSRDSNDERDSPPAAATDAAPGDLSRTAPPPITADDGGFTDDGSGVDGGGDGCVEDGSGGDVGDGRERAQRTPKPPPSRARRSSTPGRRSSLSSWLPSWVAPAADAPAVAPPPPTRDGLPPAMDAAVKAALVASRGTGIVSLVGLDLPVIPGRVRAHLPRRLTVLSLAHNPRLEVLAEDDPVVLLGPSGATAAAPPPARKSAAGGGKKGGGGKGGGGGGGTAAPPAGTPGGCLRRVILNDCGLTALPATIAVWTQLRALEVADNRLCALPNVFAAFPYLEALTAAGNALTELPQSLATCGRLVTVDLSRNALGPALPAVLCDLPSVVTLRVAANGLTSLPEALVGAAALEVLDVADNDLPAVPPVLLRCCPRLVSVDVAGNPAAERIHLSEGWEWLAERAAAVAQRTALYRLEGGD